MEELQKPSPETVLRWLEHSRGAALWPDKEQEVENALREALAQRDSFQKRFITLMENYEAARAYSSTYVKQRDEIAKAAKDFRDAMEAQDMGFRLPSSMIPNNPGSYRDLLSKLDAALAALQQSEDK